MCLLHLIAEEDLYGYAIFQKLAPIFPDVKESNMYIILRELYKSGYIGCYAGQTSGGPPRQYYHITEKGKKKLDILLIEWRYLLNSLKELGIF